MENFKYLFLRVHARQFDCQARMPAQLATEQNPETPFPFPNSLGGTHAHAFSTGHTSVHVDFGFFRGGVKMDAVVRADLDTCPAGGADFICKTGNQSGDDADVLDLGLGTCVGAFCNGDSELMVVFEISLDMLLQERKKIFCCHDFLYPFEKLFRGDRPVGAAARPKTGVDLVALDFLAHILQVPFLGCFDVRQGYDLFSCFRHLCFHTCPNLFSDEKRHSFHCILSIFCPLHDFSPKDYHTVFDYQRYRLSEERSETASASSVKRNILVSTIIYHKS